MHCSKTIPGPKDCRGVRDGGGPKDSHGAEKMVVPKVAVDPNAVEWSDSRGA
jgi:hypothetical protein